MNTLTKPQPRKQQQPKESSLKDSSSTENQPITSLPSMWSSSLIRSKMLVVVLIAAMIAAIVRNEDVSLSNGFQITVPLSTMNRIQELPTLMWKNENLRHIWYRIAQFCHIDTIRNNKDWIIWSTALYTALSDTVRAVVSNCVWLAITTKYISQSLRYVLLRIVFPSGTRMINTYVLPQLYTQGRYLITHLILYHSQLTSEQLMLELLGMVGGIVFYYFCVPYMRRLQPLVQKQYRSCRQSMQQWYNHQYELLLYSSRLLAIMTPFILYCWMVLFVQLLVPSIVYFIVVHTNCNTILSIYIPIILSVALVRNDDDDDTDSIAGDQSSGNSTGDTDETETMQTGVVTSGADSGTTITLSSSKRDSATKSATPDSLRKSNRIKARSSLKENVVNNQNSRNKVPNEQVASGTKSTPPSLLPPARHQSHEMDSINSSSRHSLRQLLLQYWIIVRMVACLGTVATHSIPYWMRRFIFALLGTVGMSSTTTNNSILVPHFEFYIYISVYVIPMITPIVVQEMISAPITTTKTVSASTAKTPSKNHHQNQMHTTLVQIYYIQYYIAPFVAYVYDAISSSISISTYESYIIVPSSKFLSIASYVSILSEPTCHYITHLIQDGRTLLIPTMIAFFVQSYPIQYLCLLYIAYVIPIYKCCLDSGTKSSTAASKVEQPTSKLQHRTTQQWLQYWVIQTVLTGTIQSMSSILYWVPFSTTVLYFFYVYITILLSPPTISHIYEQYIQYEIQYLIHSFTKSTKSLEASTSTSLSSSTTTVYNTDEPNTSVVSSSRTVQLWNYILDNVPKASMEETAKTSDQPMTENDKTETSITNNTTATNQETASRFVPEE